MSTKPMQHAQEFIDLCDDAKSRVNEINDSQLSEMLATQDVDYLIDVRDRDEFENGHIEGAIFLSKGWAEAKIHTVVDRKDARVALYCGGGQRSALVADNLQKMGYGDVLSLAGGIKGWINAGKAVV